MLDKVIYYRQLKKSMGVEQYIKEGKEIKEFKGST